MRLKDKVAIITGAGRGIGKTVALAFARNGADVVAVDLALPPVEATAGEVRALGRRALAVRADVSKWEDVARMAKVAAQELGGIDILINNAGIADIKPKPFFQVTEEEWDKIMSVNLKGVFLCCKAVFPFMKERGRGKIVNISSGTHFLGRARFDSLCQLQRRYHRLHQDLVAGSGRFQDHRQFSCSGVYDHRGSSVSHGNTGSGRDGGGPEVHQTATVARRPDRRDCFCSFR